MMYATKLIWIVLILKCNALMHENVFFHEIGKFSMSRSRWIVSFIIDLSTYERFLDKLSTDINRTDMLSDRLIASLTRPAETVVQTGHYKPMIIGLKEQLSVLRSMHDDVRNSFNDYKLLGPVDTDKLERRKRKVLGFIGDIMSDIFGVVSEGDISSITRNIKKLSRNQLELTHVVEESLSIINVSRISIQENRQKINDLITTVGNVEDKIINITDQLQKQIRDIYTALTVFTKLDLVIEEIKNALSRSMYFYTHFQLQIQSVVMQKLSPTTIPADIFRGMLLQIQEKLPKTVGLPANPRTKLFEYYKLLSCTPIFDGKRIIITVKIPLVEYSQQFDIFRAYSLPVPLLGRDKNHPEERDMLAYYKLESDYLAINSERSQYILMNENDVQQCLNTGMGICNIKGPVMNSNMARSCILSNFNQDKYKVEQFCQTWIHRTVLPTAVYLANDVYLIITDNAIVFHLSCDKKDSSRIRVDPPFGFLTLHESCQAATNHFSLMGYFQGNSTKDVRNPAGIMLKQYNISDIRVWNDINAFITFKNKSFNLPTKLANLDDFPLKSLAYELHNEEILEPMEIKRFPLWGYLCIFVAILVLILLALFIIKKYQNIVRKLICLKFKSDKMSRTPKVQTIIRNSNAAGLEENDEITVFVEGTPNQTGFLRKKFDVLDSQQK